MGVYSNLELRRAIKEGHIVFHPQVDKHINQASIDVTLGEWYFRVERLEQRSVYNPFDREDIERYFEGPHRAMPHDDWCRLHHHTPFKGIPEKHPIIVLQPQERILAHTHEFIGIKPPGASEIRSRSSWGRNGVAVCFDAGWIDPGYFTRLTLEIYNLNQHESVVLPIGERIGQVVFHHTGEVEGSYGLGRDGGHSGKYQPGNDLKKLIQTWSPDQMLPRSYLDQRVMPLDIHLEEQNND